MASRKNTGFTIGSHSTVADYNLPGTVKALQDGWSATFRTSAIVAALFAGVESVLIGFVKNAIQDEVGSSSRCGQALLAFTYLAFFLNLSAAMSSLLLTDEIGSIALRAARTVAEEQHTLDIDVYDERTSKLISRFNGGRRSWRWVMWHWAFCLIVAYICMLVQLVLYAWCTETSGIKGGVLAIAIVTSLPLLDLFPWPARQTKNTNTDNS